MGAINSNNIINEILSLNNDIIMEFIDTKKRSNNKLYRFLVNHGLMNKCNEANIISIRKCIDTLIKNNYY